MEILIWILTTYGMTNILVYGSIFEIQRYWIKKYSTFLGNLITCMMCTSTWVGFFLSLTFFSPTASIASIPYTHLFFDAMLASGSVWIINTLVEWLEENRPPSEDDF
jgi:hypothetical protein